jgi:hypothetical protein
MEEAVHQVKKGKGGPHLVRYADDFVILHEDLPVIEKCQEAVREFLAPMGLELKPEKTTITHTLRRHEGNVGFDFLGYTIRQFPQGKHQCGKSQKGTPLCFKPLIKPSKTKVQSHLQALGKIIHTLQAASQEELVEALNPKIQGVVALLPELGSEKNLFPRGSSGIPEAVWVGVPETPRKRKRLEKQTLLAEARERCLGLRDRREETAAARRDEDRPSRESAWRKDTFGWRLAVLVVTDGNLPGG